MMYSFQEFMEDSLHHPAWGYYAEGRVRFGADKEKQDFTTFPLAMRPLFGAMLAERLYMLWRASRANRAPNPSPAPATTKSGSDDAVRKFVVVELGAGLGTLANDILSHLRDHRPFMFSKLVYVIGERSESLQGLQAATNRDFIDQGVLHVHAVDAQALVTGELRMQLLSMVSSEPGGSLHGVLISNELLDAFAVDKLRLGLSEKTVSTTGTAGSGAARTVPPSPLLVKRACVVPLIQEEALARILVLLSDASTDGVSIEALRAESEAVRDEFLALEAEGRLDLLRNEDQLCRGASAAREAWLAPPSLGEKKPWLSLSRARYCDLKAKCCSSVGSGTRFQSSAHQSVKLSSDAEDAGTELEQMLDAEIRFSEIYVLVDLERGDESVGEVAAVLESGGDHNGAGAKAGGEGAKMGAGAAEGCELLKEWVEQHRDCVGNLLLSAKKRRAKVREVRGASERRGGAGGAEVGSTADSAGGAGGAGGLERGDTSNGLTTGTCEKTSGRGGQRAERDRKADDAATDDGSQSTFAVVASDETNADDNSGHLSLEVLVNRAISTFGKGASQLFDVGAVITIDYGADMHTLVHASPVVPYTHAASRTRGAQLRVRSRLQPPRRGDEICSAAEMMYARPGWCDLTADVDFSQLAAVCEREGLQTLYFGPQTALESVLPIDGDACILSPAYACACVSRASCDAFYALGTFSMLVQGSASLSSTQGVRQRRGKRRGEGGGGGERLEGKRGENVELGQGEDPAFLGAQSVWVPPAASLPLLQGGSTSLLSFSLLSTLRTLGRLLLEHVLGVFRQRAMFAGLGAEERRTETANSDRHRREKGIAGQGHGANLHSGNSKEGAGGEGGDHAGCIGSATAEVVHVPDASTGAGYMSSSLQPLAHVELVRAIADARLPTVPCFRPHWRAMLRVIHKLVESGNLSLEGVPALYHAPLRLVYADYELLTRRG